LLPFAGEVGPGTLAGMLGSLGLIGAGIGVHMRSRLNAARKAQLAGGDDPEATETPASVNEDDGANGA